MANESAATPEKQAAEPVPVGVTPVPAASSTSLVRHAVALAAVVLMLCGLTAGGHLYSPDEEIMFRTARALWTGATLAIEPLPAGPDGDGFASRRGMDGREYAQYGLGNSLLAGPLILLGELAAKIVPEEFARRWLEFETISYLPESEKRGAALVRRFVVSFQGSLILAATVVVLFLTVVRLTEEFHRNGRSRSDVDAGASPLVCGWAVGMAYVLGTMAWPHARTFFSEPLAGLGILIAFYAAAFGLITVGRCALVAAGLGLALLTRLDSAVMVPGVGLTLLLRYAGQVLDGRKVSPGEWMSLVLGQPAFALRLGALLVGPVSVALWQMTFNTMNFGGPFESAYADQTEGINFSTPLFAGLYGFLGSPGKAMLLFSPGLLLAIFGWRRFQMYHGALAAGILLAVGFKVLLHATWQNWAGGWCWGPRHIMQVHVLLMVGAWGFVVAWNPVRRIVLASVLAVGAWVQLYGSSQSFIDYYILYYRTPATQPQARALYSPNEDAATFALYQVKAIHPESGRIVDVPLNALAAPLSDSIYVPQNTQWYRYSEMARLGYTDNLWLRLYKRATNTERPLR